MKKPTPVEFSLVSEKLEEACQKSNADLEARSVAYEDTVVVFTGEVYTVNVEYGQTSFTPQSEMRIGGPPSTSYNGGQEASTTIQIVDAVTDAANVPLFFTFAGVVPLCKHDFVRLYVHLYDTEHLQERLGYIYDQHTSRLKPLYVPRQPREIERVSKIELIASFSCDHEVLATYTHQ